MADLLNVIEIFSARIEELEAQQITEPIDATNERLHKALDALQMQLDGEKTNSAYTEQLYEQALTRITELEAQAKWEPVEDGTITVGDVEGNNYGDAISVLGNSHVLMKPLITVAEKFGEEEANVYLPDHIRLCKRVEGSQQQEAIVTDYERNMLVAMIDDIKTRYQAGQDEWVNAIAIEAWLDNAHEEV